MWFIFCESLKIFFFIFKLQISCIILVLFLHFFLFTLVDLVEIDIFSIPNRAIRLLWRVLFFLFIRLFGYVLQLLLESVLTFSWSIFFAAPSKAYYRKEDTTSQKSKYRKENEAANSWIFLTLDVIWLTWRIRTRIIVLIIGAFPASISVSRQTTRARSTIICLQCQLSPIFSKPASIADI